MAEILSESSENYLEVIYELGVYTNVVRLTDVANKMSVSKASVNKAMGVLKKAGLVSQQHYGGIELTQAGRKQAQKVMNRHAKIFEFFHNVLGVDFETADKDACRVEHVISETTMEAWSRYVDECLKLGENEEDIIE